MPGMRDPRPVLGLPEPSWRYHAACRPATADLFYSGDGGRLKAIATCVSCPVIAQCREWALRTREQYGIWGGLTPAQRQRILKSRA